MKTTVRVMKGDLGLLLRGDFRSDEPEQDDEAPAPPPAAAAPHVDEAPSHASPAGEGAAPRMDFRLSGDRMSGARRAWEVAHHLFRVGRRRYTDAKAQPGGMVGAALRWQGPSVEDQSAYAKGRAWVPRGFAGGQLEAMGVIFHAIIGRPAVAIGNAVKWLGGWPLHATITAVAGSLVWWGLHGALGMPGGALPLIVTLATLGAWVIAAAVMNLALEHQAAKPPGNIREHPDDDEPDDYDDEEYPR